MKVSDLIAELQMLPQDLEVSVTANNHGTNEITTSVRQDVDPRTGEVKQEWVSVGNESYAFTPISDERMEELKAMVLGELKDPSRVFTTIHGDYRFYTPSWGPQASCYGSKYDPRVFFALKEDGKIDLIDDCSHFVLRPVVRMASAGDAY